MVKVGLLGCGVVGGGVVESLHQNANYIQDRTGVAFQITRVAVRDMTRNRSPHVLAEWLTTNWRAVCTATDVDMVVEAMGGLEPAYAAVTLALQSGKHVVTANKELMAHYGTALTTLAAKNRCKLLFEASALGGVPALHALETYFQANRIRQIQGIVNGTSNYVLTRMEDAGLSIDDAVREAQAAGYAEADPSMDIDGFDAQFKLQILTRLAFDTEFSIQDVNRRGIRSVDIVDVRLAKRLGGRIKHVVRAAKSEGEPCMCADVTPSLVLSSHGLYGVNGVQNALVVEGDLVGQIVLAGPGAGSLPTASAVVEDLIKVAKWQGEDTGAVPKQQEGSCAESAYNAVLVRRLTTPEELVGPCREIWSETVRAVDVRYQLDPETGAEAWLLHGPEIRVTEVFLQLQRFGHARCAAYPVIGPWTELIQHADRAGFVSGIEDAVDTPDTITA